MKRKITCLYLAIIAVLSALPSGAVGGAESLSKITAVESTHRSHNAATAQQVTDTNAVVTKVESTAQSTSGITPRANESGSDMSLPSRVQTTAVCNGEVDMASVMEDSGIYVLEAATLCTGAGIGDSSASYRLDWAAGELAVSEGESPLYRMDVGVLYEGLWQSCSCPFQCDYDADGFLTALDLAALIDVLFAGRPEIQEASCPSSRGDFDCDGFPTALDLAGLIDHLFAGGNAPCDPCSL